MIFQMLYLLRGQANGRGERFYGQESLTANLGTASLLWWWSSVLCSSFSQLCWCFDGSHLTSNNDDWNFIRQFGCRWSPSWRQNEDFYCFSTKKGIVLTFATVVFPRVCFLVGRSSQLRTLQLFRSCWLLPEFSAIFGSVQRICLMEQRSEGEII